MLGGNFGKSRQGTGTLFVYGSDSQEVGTNHGGNYQVQPGVTYHFEIHGITEYQNMGIKVWARYKIGDSPAQNNLIGTFTVGPNPSTIEFDWTVPNNLPITSSIKFKYGTDYQGSMGEWQYAKKDVDSSPRLLLVVPEVFLGSIGAIAALFGGFTIKTIRGKHK